MQAVAAGGHALFLVAYLLPWVTGSLGRREALSGFALAGVAEDALALEAAPFALAAVIALYAAPALAAGALALLLLRRALGIDARTALAMSAGVALMPLATGAVTAAGVPLGWWNERITGLAPGLLLAIVAATVALAASATALARPGGRRERCER